MITLENYKKNALTLLFKVISEGNEELLQEIKEANEQKKKFKDKHIFDIFDSRRAITYDDIYKNTKKIIKELQEQDNTVFPQVKLQLEKKDIIVENGKFFIANNHSNKLLETRISFSLPNLRVESVATTPLVLLRKNEYEELLFNARQTVINENETFDLEDVLKDAIARKASDIHLNFSPRGVHYMTYKIYGNNTKIDKFMMEDNKAFEFINKFRQKASKDVGIGFVADDYVNPQGSSMKYSESLGVDLRLQATPSGKGDNRCLYVWRILKKDVSTGNIDSLHGYGKIFREILWESTRFSRGVIIFAGVTNSGKSTATSALLMSMPENKAIISIEDPIEYSKNKWNITEHQISEVVHEDGKVTGMSYLSGVKSAKRSDPDIFNIGEIRKEGAGGTELGEAVNEATKAGNLGLSTIHVSSVYDLHSTLVSDYGFDRSSISDILLLGVNQILVEEICPKCRIEADKENKEKMEKLIKRGSVRYYHKKDLEEYLKDDNVVTYKRNDKGCSNCFNGVVGLTPIYEYIRPTVDDAIWLHENLDKLNRFSLEKYFCEKEDPYVSRNKLSCYIDILKEGRVDADDETLTRVMF